MKHVSTIVFNGGGFNGIAFIGALQKLIENGLSFESIDCLCGTSIGSLLCLLINIDYKPSEMYDMILNKNFSELKQLSLLNIMKYFGLDRGDGMENWFKDLLESKDIDKNITYLELYSKTNINLTTVSYNLTKEMTVYCNYKNTPDLKITQGLRMSMAVPFMFSPVCYKDDYYIDGGISELFPLSSFVDISDKVLGLRLVPHGKKEQCKSSNFSEYTSKVIETLLNESQSQQCQKYIKLFENIIEINTENKDFLNFNMDAIYKKKLYEIGYNSV